MLERILIPLDGSATAEAALAQLRPLLLVKDSEVLLVQVVPVLPAFEGAWAESPQALAVLQESGEAYVRKIRVGLESQGARVRSIVRAGFPAETILNLAEKEGATLIAMTTHGRTGLARWALGSVAEKVLRASSVPVLAVRSFVRGPGGETLPAAGKDPSFRRILVCVDNSDLSLEVVPAAVELAGAFGSQVNLLNVLEDHLAYGPPVPQLNRAYDLFRDAGVKPEPILRKGDPASEILDAAAEIGADLIAMTTHGRSGLQRWTLGSVTERILRSSTTPMLVVRSGRPVAAARSRSREEVAP